MSIDGIFNSDLQLIWRSAQLETLLSGAPEVQVQLSTPGEVAFWNQNHHLLTLKAQPVPLNTSCLTGLVLEQRLSLQDLHDAAYTDPLTGLGNRRAFEETLKQATQQDHPLALVILDLDGLKTINDRYGHVQGDAFLTFVAHKLKQQLRPADQAFRIGGDEFALLLPGLEAAEVHVVYGLMKNIRQQLESSPFHDGDVSAGVAFHPRESLGDARTLMYLADERMYEHKRSKTSSAGSGNLIGTINRRAVIRGMNATLEVLLSREVPGPDYWKLMLEYAIQMVPSAQAGSLDLWNGNAFVKVAQFGFDDGILGVELSPKAQKVWYGGPPHEWGEGRPRILRDVREISTVSYVSAEVSGDPGRIRVFQEAGKLAHILCTLNAPITHQGKVYGHLNLDNFVSSVAFNQDSVQVTMELVRQCATVCFNLNLPAHLP